MKIDFSCLKQYPIKDRTVEDYFEIAKLAYEEVTIPNFHSCSAYTDESQIRLQKQKYYESRTIKGIDCLPLVDLRCFTTGYYGVSLLDLRATVGDFGKVDYCPNIIIAHRGSDALHGDWSDSNIAIALQQIPDQFDKACDLMEATYKCLGRRKCKVVHVGHSLGAALAQMAAFYYGQEAKGFETPGTENILRKICPNKQINPESLVSFNMEGSLVSGLLPSVGRVIKREKSFKVKLIESLLGPSLLGVVANLQLLHRMGAIEKHINSDGNFVAKSNSNKSLGEQSFQRPLSNRYY